MTLPEYIAHLRQDRGESVDLRYERLRIARELEALTPGEISTSIPTPEEIREAWKNVRKDWPR